MLYLSGITCGRGKRSRFEQSNCPQIFINSELFLLHIESLSFWKGGTQIIYDDQDWVYNQEKHEKIPNPVEYRHTLSNVLNGLIETGFVISHVSDNFDMNSDINAEPKTWEHFTAFAPPWLSILASYRPDFKIE